MAITGIKDHPVEMPGVDDQIKTSKVKHTRRSTGLDVPNWPKKKDQPRKSLINLDSARLSPEPKRNEERATSQVDLDMHRIYPSRPREETSSVSTRKTRRIEL